MTRDQAPPLTERPGPRGRAASVSPAAVQPPAAAFRVPSPGRSASRCGREWADLGAFLWGDCVSCRHGLKPHEHAHLKVAVIQEIFREYSFMPTLERVVCGDFGCEIEVWVLLSFVIGTAQESVSICDLDDCFAQILPPSCMHPDF